MKKDIFIALIPVVVLIVVLGITIHVFGSEALSGASQTALIASAGLCCFLAMTHFKVKWKTLEDGIRENIASVSSPIVILLLIGAISGTWILSGVVPLLIYYGLQIISPSFFLVCTCLICAIVSVMTGSSWTTIATIGIALLGIGQAQGFSEGVIAGAIISGAYFGDKMSPLSDTTVMASSLSDVPLFRHIRYLVYTVVPTMLITLAIFTVMGLAHTVTDAGEITLYVQTLEQKFHLTPWLLIVPVLTGVMIARRMPALIVLFLSSVIAAIAALIFQPHILIEVAGAHAPQGLELFTGMIKSIYGETQIETGVPVINELVSTSGMAGMLQTVWLIVSAMTFGACMTASGMLHLITRLLVPLCQKRTGMVATTVTSGTLLNAMVADQYLSIILTSNMFKRIYRERGYEDRLLSRSLEDSCTVTSPLIPWSSCGMTQATILGVPTLTYLPYCFFNLISPLMSICIAAIGYKIKRQWPINSKP